MAVWFYLFTALFWSIYSWRCWRGNCGEVHYSSDCRGCCFYPTEQEQVETNRQRRRGRLFYGRFTVVFVVSFVIFCWKTVVPTWVSVLPASNYQIVQLDGRTAKVWYESSNSTVSTTTTQLVKFDEQRSCLAMREHAGFYQDEKTCGLGKTYYAQPTIVPTMVKGTTTYAVDTMRGTLVVVPNPPKNPSSQGTHFGRWCWESTGPTVDKGAWVWIEDNLFHWGDPVAYVNDNAAGCASSWRFFSCLKIMICD